MSAIRWPGATNDKGAVSRSRFLANLFVNRDDLLFPEPWIILADGGFHLRSCFLSPADTVPPNLSAQDIRSWGQFNFLVSSARCIVENCIGLLKIKWRRFHKHQIAEETDIVPDLIICACVLHNICIDAGDVNAEEAGAVRDPDERYEEQREIALAYNRVTNNVHADMMRQVK